MNEQERTALTLASLDAAIQVLTTQRDLLAMSLLGAFEYPTVGDDVPDGECAHPRITQVAVMGSDGVKNFCIDCEQVLE